MCEIVWAIPRSSKDCGRWIIIFFNRKFFANFLLPRFLLTAGQFYAFLFSEVVLKLPCDCNWVEDITSKLRNINSGTSLGASFKDH